MKLLSEFLQDVRFGVRMFGRRRGLAATAVLTLALGIGVNVAMFSVVNAVLIRRLPFPSPDQLVKVGESSLTDPMLRAFNPGNYVDLRRETTDVFAALGAYRLTPAATLTSEGADAVKAMTITARPEFFDVLGVAPALGRLITEADVASDSRSVVISSEFWRARLGADPQVLGRQLELDGTRWSVIGVLPDGAVFPLNAELWQPLRFTTSDLEQRNSWNTQVVGRLKAGVTLDRANTSASRAMVLVGQSHPGPMPRTARVADLRDTLVGTVRTDLLFAQGIAFVVLLIACANLANLMLASAASRRQEFGIRVSIGAGRGRLLRQLLAESLVISGTGSFLGALLAVVLVPTLVTSYPGTLPGRELIGVRWTELGVAIAAAFATTAIFGLVPALIASRSRAPGLPASSARIGAPRAASWLQGGLVTAEVSMTLALLAGSFLLIRSFSALTNQQIGFSSEHVATAYLQIPSARFPADADRRRVFDELREQLSQLPDTQAVAVSFPLPFDLTSMGSTMRWDPALGLDVPLSSTRRYVSPQYLDALSIPLRRGRFFTPADTDGAPPVAVVNESFAAKYGHPRDVVGMRFIGKDNALVTIVGVVADVRTTFVRPAEPELMLALAQNALVMGSFIIKSRAPVDRINAEFHQVLRARYPYLPAGQVATVSSVIDSSVAQTRYNMALLTGLAALAMVLSAVGIYGVMAYVVSQQRRAMAIRLALGASPRHVQSLSIRQGLTPILFGIAGGLAGAWFLTTLVKKELFHVRPHDPLPMAIAAMGLFIVGVAACWIPSRRTARINPVTVLKTD